MTVPPFNWCFAPLPGEMSSSSSPNAVEDPTNCLYPSPTVCSEALPNPPRLIGRSSWPHVHTFFCDMIAFASNRTHLSWLPSLEVVIVEHLKAVVSDENCCPYSPAARPSIPPVTSSTIYAAIECQFFLNTLQHENNKTNSLFACIC
ncbi:unnamed protein product [Dibothriocephalus latus]|uniref:Uncharacterized protein n=1 Tax=Dibothriocephalus latus TaxID=60516 RepID=A0A3P7P3W6_DIBLA|nr:unnamed protein product [Dibothriocephalus latus]